MSNLKENVENDVLRNVSFLSYDGEISARQADKMTHPHLGVAIFLDN